MSVNAAASLHFILVVYHYLVQDKIFCVNNYHLSPGLPLWNDSTYFPSHYLRLASRSDPLPGLGLAQMSVRTAIISPALPLIAVPLGVVPNDLSKLLFMYHLVAA